MNWTTRKSLPGKRNPKPFACGGGGLQKKRLPEEPKSKSTTPAVYSAGKEKSMTYMFLAALAALAAALLLGLAISTVARVREGDGIPEDIVLNDALLERFGGAR